MIRKMLSELRLEGQDFGHTWMVSARSVEAYQASTKGLEKHAHSTVNRIKCVVNGVQGVSCLTQLSLLDCGRFRSTWQRKVKIPNRRGKAGRCVTDGEIGALFRAFARDATASGVRDAAMLA